MKRKYVVPDLLASMTAGVPFAPKPELRAGEPADREQRSICSLGRWFNAEPARSAAPVESRALRLTLDDDWVGGWYARTQWLQAATLANAQVRDKIASNEVAGGETNFSANVVTQFKDFS
jgi:hypothetical protein